MGVIQLPSSQRTAALGLLNGGMLRTMGHGLRLGLGLTEVLPRVIRDKVACPRVRDLMDEDVGQRAVASEEGGRGEGEARILHPAIREGRRQHEHVVTLPHVRLPDNLLCYTQELLAISKLPCCRLDHRGLRPHGGAWANIDSA